MQHQPEIVESPQAQATSTPSESGAGVEVRESSEGK